MSSWNFWKDNTNRVYWGAPPPNMPANPRIRKGEHQQGILGGETPPNMPVNTRTRKKFNPPAKTEKLYFTKENTTDI